MSRARLWPRGVTFVSVLAPTHDLGGGTEAVDADPEREPCLLSTVLILLISAFEHSGKSMKRLIKIFILV